MDSLSDQWRELNSYRTDIEHLLNKEPPEFWLELKQVTDANNKPKFDILVELMCTLLVLPHSSACVERVFSQVNIVKTKQTNKLLCETVSNRILAKQAVVKDGVCHTWNPSKSLLEDMREGRCRQRYAKSIEFHKKENTLSISNTDLDEGEVIDIDC